MRKEIPWILASFIMAAALYASFIMAAALGVLAAQDVPKDAPRHIDFTQVIKDLDGQPLPINSEGKLPSVATLGKIAKDALTNILPGDDQLTGSGKFDHWQLAQKVYPDKSDVVLTAEELATIKERIGKAYGPIVVGPAWKMLDPGMKGSK
jgi:hypothetical protein